MRLIGAAAAPMEESVSNTINVGRFGSAARNNSSRCAMSLWRKICFSHFDWRTPSIMELWFDVSDRMRQFDTSLAMVEIAVSLGTYPDGKQRAVSFPRLVAQSPSRP